MQILKKLSHRMSKEGKARETFKCHRQLHISNYPPSNLYVHTLFTNMHVHQPASLDPTAKPILHIHVHYKHVQ